MTPEQRAERLHYHMYETNEGIREQSERIVALEELVADLWDATYRWLFAGEAPYEELEALYARIKELEVPL